MLVLLLSAVDQTIVSTALPTIVGDLGGLDRLSWVVTAYLLTSDGLGSDLRQAGDVHGRKVVLQTALAIFILGSALCGTSQNMTELIAFRGLQGLGGGGLSVVTLAVVGDLVSPRERGRDQGYFGAVFGVATVLGPLLGGFFVGQPVVALDLLREPPLGVAAFVVIPRAFQSRRSEAKRLIDDPGGALLTGGLSAIVLYTSLGGTTYPWAAPRDDRAAPRRLGDAGRVRVRRIACAGPDPAALALP